MIITLFCACLLGSFDAMLDDHEARSAIPTAAQVHYDTIQKLQTKPIATSHTRNVSTSMSKDDFPHRKFEFQTLLSSLLHNSIVISHAMNTRDTLSFLIK